MKIETPFQDLLTEINALVRDYKDTCTSIPREKVQDYRDKLSHLSVTLSHYAADFYEDALGAEMRRKIEEARETDRLLESKECKSQATAALKARVTCEKYYLEEVQTEALSKRAFFIRETVSQVLNSISSRLHSFGSNG